MACALTIAGSDSGGGAGIQADLKTFQALGVHGTSAITCITAQNPKGVMGIHPVPAKMVAGQIEAVLDGFPVTWAKTGMLFSKEIIEAVVSTLAGTKVNLVVDPVMVSTSGARLLKTSAEKALMDKLFPQAALITPNLDELSLLTARKIEGPEEMRAAAHVLHQRYGCAVLAKGGHLQGSRSAIDLLYDGENEWLLELPFVRGVSTHGTGCTLSAAITAWLARKENLWQAVVAAKEYLHGRIAGSRRSGKYSVMA